MFRRTALLYLLVIGIIPTAAVARGQTSQTQSASNNDPVSPEALPPDLPLPASPPNQAPWLRDANVLQPYDHSEFAALTNLGNRPKRLRDEFGFNAIIVQPPDSHNTVAGPKDKLTEAQFRVGIAAYKSAGYRVMLYTSVMALGLSPEFQSGEISRTHPDWAQRDPKGNPILVWGVPWLCPNTGAREAALDRCIRIVRDYHPDGVMLDNNQFFATDAGWTCHCQSCTKLFRDYVKRRCGEQKATGLFGVPTDKLQIPTKDGPLFALWMQWRNRVWAEINESFRAKLREVDPNIMLFANTQYAFDDGRLATDQQYEREDVVLSESVALGSRAMSEKMVLGHALAAGRPLWNYIGTFAKPDDYTGLRPAAVIGPAIASTIANGARPWIVDGFDDGPTDPAARKEMSRLLGWHGHHPELFNGEPWAGVGALVSVESRNVRHTRLIPPDIAALQSVATPVIARRDDEVSAESLQRFHVLTVETSPCLSAAAANVIAKWVNQGGMLLAAADTGMFDELGRPRTPSTLWEALGLESAPTNACGVGRGTVVAPDAKAFAATAVERTRAWSFQVPPESGVEIVPYRQGQSLILHIVRHQPASHPIKLRLPDELRATGTDAQLLVPGSQPSSIPLSEQPDGAWLEMKDVPLYCVLVIATA